MVEQCTLLEAIPNTWFQAGFGHLTGYQGGYYGYLWSKVFAEDMAERFKDLGMLSPEAGAYYRMHVLSRGGSADASDMLHDYPGPRPKARRLYPQPAVTVSTLFFIHSTNTFAICKWCDCK